MKMLKAVVVAVFLATTTAHAAGSYQTRYALDSAGNLVEQQYLVPDESGKVWKTIGIIALGILGVAGAVWLVEEWTDDDDDPPPVADNGLVPQGGSSHTEWSTDYLIPTYTTVQ